MGTIVPTHPLPFLDHGDVKVSAYRFRPNNFNSLSLSHTFFYNFFYPPTIFLAFSHFLPLFFFVDT